MIQKIVELPQQQQIVLLIVVLVLFYGAWAYGISPAMDEVTALDGRISQLNDEIDRAKIMEARLPQFEQEVASLTAQLEELKLALPDSKETAEIVRRVEELAVESNLAIRSFTPQATVRYDFYEDWPIGMSLEGSYANLGLFFQKVANFQRIINVDNINIQALGGTDRARSISATCTATTFVFTESEGT